MYALETHIHILKYCDRYTQTHTHLYTHKLRAVNGGGLVLYTRSVCLELHLGPDKSGCCPQKPPLGAPSEALGETPRGAAQTEAP